MELIDLNIGHQSRKFHHKNAGLVYMPMAGLLRLYIRIIRVFKQ